MPQLEVSNQTITPTTALIALRGEATAESIGLLRETIAQTLTGECRNLVVDLAGVTHIDSAGFGALIGGLRRARLLNGSLCLLSPQGNVQSLIVRAQLHKVLFLFERVEDAVDHLESV